MAQQWIALLLVGMAGYYLIRQWVGAWRRIWRGEDTGCGGGCGKCSCGSKQSASKSPTNAKTSPVLPAHFIKAGDIGDFRRNG